MKKIEGFQCDKCGTIFSSEELALSCEQKQQSRQEGAKIMGMRFPDQKGQYGMGLDFSRNVPDSIMVKFSDQHGDFAQYVLKHYGYKGL